MTPLEIFLNGIYEILERSEIISSFQVDLLNLDDYNVVRFKICKFVKKIHFDFMEDGNST